MKSARLEIPQLGLIAVTRAMAGAGAGLLLADRLSPQSRRAVGWTLLAIGALSTIPLALEIKSSLDDSRRDSNFDRGPDLNRSRPLAAQERNS